MSRRGCRHNWLRLNPQLPNEAFAEIVVIARDVKGARTDQGGNGGEGGQLTAPLTEARVPDRPLQFRPRRSAFRANSRDRPDANGCATSPFFFIASFSYVLLHKICCHNQLLPVELFSFSGDILS